MNRSKIISILIICTMFFSFTETFGKDAAKFRIVKIIQITSDGEYYQNPKLSPDGNMVVFRGRNGGLFIRNTDGTGPMVTVLSLGKGTRDYAWSPDSKTIAFKQKTVEESKRISNTLHTFNVKTKQSTLMKTDVPGYGFLRWADRGIEIKSVVPVKNQETGSFDILNKIFDVSDKELRQSKDPIVYFVQVDRKNFVIVEDGNGNVLSKTGGYILPIMSPQNDKFLATSSARTHVLNLSGEILTDLGYADNEMWSEDGELIIYQIGEAGGFHGQTLIGSEIFIINIDGTYKNQLTHTPDIIEMKPHWSGDASKITYFDESTGKIFVSELEYDE